jgi:hypothetical protein
MQIFRGRFITKQKEASYVGHRVQVEFEERVDLDSAPKTPSQHPAQEPLFKSAMRNADVSSNGTFEIELPAVDRLREPLWLELKAPDGAVLHRDKLTLQQLDNYNAAVDPKTPLGIEAHPDRFKGLRAKLTGRVFDQEGGQPFAGLQVIVWAKRDEDKQFRPVAVAFTDNVGYFTTELPREKFTEAYAQISQIPDHTVPIRLENDGMLPDRLIVVVPLTQARLQSGSDCGCAHGSRAVLDPIDLVSSPGAYSSLDVGGGKCVEFTIPNRTLEEFSYYKIIRTTDPEIRGLTITEPASLPPAVVSGIIDSILKGVQIKKLVLPQPISFNPHGISEGPRSEAIVGAAAGSTSALPSLASTLNEDVETGVRILEKQGLRLQRRMLEELSADIDLFTPSQLMTAERRIAMDSLLDQVQALTKKVPGRGVLNVDNPLDWDETPTFYQATTIAHGHILHFKQVWRADGYSLGDLLYSLPLAPCQKKQIAIIDWERREAATRVEAETAEERLFATLSRDRDISEITQAAAAESLRAGSRSEVESWAAGGGLGFGIDGFVIGAGGGAGGSSATSSAWQDSAQQFSASSLQQLRDSTVQAASAVRGRRSTVVQTVRQGETMRVQTEVVANHNHCHAMTIQYFEVLRHFLVSHELVDVQECLFVPLLMSRFDSAKALRWREALSYFLRDRRLRGGFDALERIRLNYAGSDLPTGSYAEGQIQHLDGELQIAFTIARPRDPLQNEDFVNYVMETWRFWTILLGGNAGDIYNSFLKNQEAKDRIFREQLAPRIAEAFTAALQISLVDENGYGHPVDLDPTLVSNYREGVPLYVRLNSSGTVPGLRREQIKGIRIRTTHELPPGSKVIVHTAFFRYRTAHLNHHLFQNARVMNDLSPSDDVFLSTPLDRTELRNPRNEDQELSRRLLKHLNENLEYYHRAIWLSMDPNRRYMLLDGFLAPNSGGRSVASVVENRLIGIIGNCMVLPVAPGFNLDPTYRKTDDRNLLDVYAPLTPIPPVRVSVPTRGVFAEAVLGSCNSCETKDESRFWRWEESPCPDQPTPIEAVSTESRRAEPPGLHTQGFPAPIIAMQNAPAAPDPTGLAAALQVLANPSLFRDITGLTETQRNALAALQSAFNMAQAFGKQAMEHAANLALRRNMTRDIDKTMRTIQQARSQGLLNEDQARSLTESAIRSMIGGGTQTSAQPMTPSQVQALTNTAGANQAAVRVQRPDGDTVDIDARPSQGVVRTAALRQPLRTVTGYFGARAVSDTELRQAIRTAVENELQNWRSGRTVLTERDDSQFGHLVRYWLARYSAITPDTLTAAQSIAIGGTVKYEALLDQDAQDVSGAVTSARKALLTGAPRQADPDNLNALVEQALHDARGSRFDNVAWSAVFVCACIRAAAIQLGLEAVVQGQYVGRDLLLLAHEAHWGYVLKAYQRTSVKPARRGCYHAFKPDERDVQVGDIIVLDRQVNTLPDVIRFDQIRTVLPGGRKLHGDIVVEVTGDYCVAIGGNLSESVRRRRYPLNQGRLVVDPQQLFTQEDDDGYLDAVPRPLEKRPKSLVNNNTARIFALLSLVEDEIVVPGQPVDGGVLV